jgi:hypothetical protein
LELLQSPFSHLYLLSIEFIHNKACACYTWHPIFTEVVNGCHHHREDIARES